MPITKPTRRLVTAADVMADAIEKSDFEKPITPTPTLTKSLGELERVQRQLTLASLALNKYERKLELGQELTYDEERMFLMHQDSIRKLEVALSQLKARNNTQSMTDLDICLDMIDRGMSEDDAIRMFGGNVKLAESLKEALRDRD